MWRCGELVDAKGGLSQQLDALLRFLQAIAEAGEELSEEDAAEIDEALAADEQAATDLFVAPDVSDQPADVVAQAQQINERMSGAAELFVEAVQATRDYLVTGAPELPDHVRGLCRSADALLDQVDALNQRLGAEEPVDPADSFVG